jgi:hypothetical protein
MLIHCLRVGQFVAFHLTGDFTQTQSDALKATFTIPLILSTFFHTNLTTQTQKPLLLLNKAEANFPKKPSTISSQEMRCSLAVVRLLQIEAEANPCLLNQTWCPSIKSRHGQTTHLHHCVPLSSHVLCPAHIFTNPGSQHFHMEYYD